MNPNADVTSMMLSVFFGALGAGYVAVRAQAAGAGRRWLSGVALIVFPVLRQLAGWMTLVIGAAIAAVPYFWRP